MKGPLLVLDVHYLCHRAFHSQGKLSHNGRNTGVVFGFLKSISTLKDDFNTDRIVFCFEGHDLIRKTICPEYKSKRNRKFSSPEEAKHYSSLGLQISNLKMRYLPQIGFKNIFSHPRLESDDIMAAIAKDAEEEIVLITSDSDLYQCIRPNVSIYSPQKQKLFTLEWFRETYRIYPREWAVVKAICGCKTDNVAGIRGIGELTALKFVRGELDKNSKPFRTIMSKQGRETVRRNRELVELPFRGYHAYSDIEDDEISREGWEQVCDDLGILSLAGKLPLSTRGLQAYAARKQKRV